MRLNAALVVSALALTAAAKKNKKQDENHIPLDVKIAKVDGTQITVTLTNKWKKDVNLFKRMSILDPNPVKKVNITSENGEPVKFIGANARISRDNLDKKSFERLNKNKSLNVTFDISDMYDLSAGGKFEFTAQGGVPWSKSKNTKLVGTAPYAIEKTTIEVDRKGLAMKKKLTSQKSVLMADCNADRLMRVRESNAVCSMLATVAGVQALNGDAEQFFRYFRTKDPGVRQLVSKRFFAVADECAGKTRVSTTYCSDALKLCQSDYISVTLGTQITNCDMFWKFPVLTDKCHAYDQATLTIHETTHVDGLFDPSTVDFRNNYGWPALSFLTPEQAITNADNYQHYANSVYSGVGC